MYASYSFSRPGIGVSSPTSYSALARRNPFSLAAAAPVATAATRASAALAFLARSAAEGGGDPPTYGPASGPGPTGAPGGAPYGRLKSDVDVS